MKVQRSAWLITGVAVAFLAWAGCGGGDNDSEAAGKKSAEETAAAVTVPAGTELVVALESPVSTEANREGDAFQATLERPVMVGGETVLPAGTTVRGYIQDLVEPDAEGPTKLALVVNEVEHPTGETLTLSTGPLELVSETTAEDDIEKIAIGTVAGGIIGGVVGGTKGAAAGAAAGAGAGTIVAIATGQDDQIEIPAGQKLLFRTTQALRAPLA